MKDVLDSLLKAETQAKALLDEADRDAADTVAEARNQARKQAQALREDALAAARKNLDQARTRAEAERQALLDTARDDASGADAPPQDLHDKAVTLAVNLLHGHALDSQGDGD